MSERSHLRLVHSETASSDESLQREPHTSESTREFVIEIPETWPMIPLAFAPVQANTASSEGQFLELLMRNLSEMLETSETLEPSRTEEEPQMPNSDTPSREEIDAKLAAISANINTDLVRIDAKLDGIATNIDNKFDKISGRVEEAINSSGRAEAAANDAKKSSATVKWNIVFTGLTVIAVVLAFWALWLEGVGQFADLIKETLGREQ